MQGPPLLRACLPAAPGSFDGPAWHGSPSAETEPVGHPRKGDAVYCTGPDRLLP